MTFSSACAVRRRAPGATRSPRRSRARAACVVGAARRPSGKSGSESAEPCAHHSGRVTGWQTPVRDPGGGGEAGEEQRPARRGPGTGVMVKRDFGRRGRLPCCDHALLGTSAPGSCDAVGSANVPFTVSR